MFLSSAFSYYNLTCRKLTCANIKKEFSVQKFLDLFKDGLTSTVSSTKDWSEKRGRGGGASVRAMAFYPSGPGLNPGGAPGSNIGFFVSVVGIFLIIKDINQGDFPLLSYHQTMSVHYRVINCSSNEKYKPEKRPGMAHIKKKIS